MKKIRHYFLAAILPVAGLASCEELDDSIQKHVNQETYVELDEDMKRVIESYSDKSVEVTRSFVDWDNVVDFYNKQV